MIVLLSPAALLLIVPPLLFLFIIQRRLKQQHHRRDDDDDEEAVIVNPRLPDSLAADIMTESHQTQSTRLSTALSQQQIVENVSTATAVVVGRRSIGVQLSTISLGRSVQSTPSLMHNHQQQSRSLLLQNKHRNRLLHDDYSPKVTDRCGRLLDDSTLSLGAASSSEQDFEYDYYEPAMPGSYLLPASDDSCFFTSQIDIDQIIGDSMLIRNKSSNDSIIDTRKSCSVSTQIDIDHQ